jgi:hypothetical protein
VTRFYGKRLALLAIRLLMSVNLLYAAIFLKFAGVPGRWPCSHRCRKQSMGWYPSRYSDALTVMLLSVIYLLLTRGHSHGASPKVWGRWLPSKRTKNSWANG